MRETATCCRSLRRTRLGSSNPVVTHAPEVFSEERSAGLTAHSRTTVEKVAAAAVTSDNG